MAAAARALYGRAARAAQSREADRCACRYRAATVRSFVRWSSARPAAGFEIVALGRPELDLAGQRRGHRGAIEAPRARRDRLGRRIHAVDQAETEPELAFAVNARGAAARSRAAARELRVPLIHLSTDYVFDGIKSVALCRGRSDRTAGVYGASKLAGEQAVLAAQARSRDAADGLGLQPVRQQFREDDAAPRRRARGDRASLPTSAAIRPARSTSPTAISRSPRICWRTTAAHCAASST